MAIKFALSAAQTQLLHASSVGAAGAFVGYLSDSLSHWSLGGPAVVIRSLVGGAILAAVSKGLGIYYRGVTAS